MLKLLGVLPESTTPRVIIRAQHALTCPRVPQPDGRGAAHSAASHNVFRCAQCYARPHSDRSLRNSKRPLCPKIRLLAYGVRSVCLTIRTLRSRLANRLTKCAQNHAGQWFRQRLAYRFRALFGLAVEICAAESACLSLSGRCFCFSIEIFCLAIAASYMLTKRC